MTPSDISNSSWPPSNKSDDRCDEDRTSPKHGIAVTLSKSLKNPAASSCADEKLLRVLKNYDPVKEGHFLLEQLPPNSFFVIRGGRMFKKGEKIRKRYKCQEVHTGKWFLFSPVYEVVVAGE